MRSRLIAAVMVGVTLSVVACSPRGGDGGRTLPVVAIANYGAHPILDVISRFVQTTHD